ncbi:3'-kinase [Sinorhizobium medicae]|uniref:3'-kinase n=3 Tax=Sinorhizobium medicae TaxID=110321 RepID=A0A6G1WUI9_9HYPH|nr:3'-kinase [Sinorhizobium medicae]MQX85505.1 3'-kinase [Sinorhizobium medicae]RVJ79685.1 3'-kinase [Sinorhizobium medicae]
MRIDYAARMFTSFIDKWALDPAGEPILTRTSRLLPVRWRGLPAMLKVADEPEEISGGRLMKWWDGHGAARVYAATDNAILIERSDSRRSLFHMAMTGSDDAATRIICRTVASLHAPRPSPPAGLAPLERWFQALAPAARIHGGVLGTCADAARFLFSAPGAPVVLHGDIHHGNILDFDDRGWLAIDPKGLLGERGFDYANLFCNPELPLGTFPGRLHGQLAVVAHEARLEPRRLLHWIVAYAGLSAAWFLGDGKNPESTLTIAEIAASELHG